MLRPVLAALALAAGLAGCSVCNRIANAEAAADDKGKACSSGSNAWNDAKLKQCSDNLSKCSPDDQKFLDTYADCLNGLPVCKDGQGFSWGLQRLGCIESLFKVSSACAKGL